MAEKTKHLPADERRADAVKSVVELAGTQNPSEITTSAIAEHMNLTQGALFRHFSTKDALWQAVMMWVAERLLARIDLAAQGIESPLGALQAMFMGHIEFVVDCRCALNFDQLCSLNIDQVRKPSFAADDCG